MVSSASEAFRFAPMEEFDEVTIRSRRGTGSAIVKTLRTNASRYVHPDIEVTAGSADDETITVRTHAVDLVALLVTMAEPTAEVTVRAARDDE